MFSDEHTAIQPDVNPDEAQARESGWFILSRCIFEHPVVGARAGHPRITPKNPNPVPYGWAWIWLLREASYRTRTKVVRGKSYKLNVGELACSESFMAEAWGWGDKAVQCFLRKLRDHKMIIWGGQKGTEVRVLTICNYPRYQMKLQVEGTSAGTTEAKSRAPTRKKDSKEDNRSLSESSDLLPFVADADKANPPKSDTRTKAEDPVAAELTEVAVAFKRWNEVARECGFRKANRLTPERKKKLTALLKDGGLETFERALAQMTKAKFMSGENDRGWRAHLDFLFEKGKYDRILDGAYEGVGRKKSDGPRHFGLPVFK